MVLIMKRVLRWLLMVAVAFLVVAGIAAAPLISEIWEHRRICDELYDRVEAALTPLDVLDAAPTGAVPVGERDHECGDTDDHYPTISRSYRPPEQHSSSKAIESFYRDLAQRNGWKITPAEHSTKELGCIVKEVEGTEITLDVWFSPEPKGTYIVSASTWPC